jgi:hypothetical protein
MARFGRDEPAQSPGPEAVAAQPERVDLHVPVDAVIVYPSVNTGVCTSVTLKTPHNHAGVQYAAGETISVQSHDVDVLRHFGVID